MSERWKYQIKFGLFWGIFMTLFDILFKIREYSILEQILNPKFYFGAFSEIIVGVFIIGYLFWKYTKKPVK